MGAFQHFSAVVHREDLSQPAFAYLSEALLAELRLCTYRKLVLQAPFFQTQPAEVIANILTNLHDQVFLPADFIMKYGDEGRELFFIRKGVCAVYTGIDAPVWGKSDEIANFSAGSYFGEMGLLTGRPRAAWIMAKTYLVTSIFPYSALEELRDQHPHAFTLVVHQLVKGFKMSASLTWDEVSRRMSQGLGLSDIEDAFAWFCAQNETKNDDEITAKAFDKALCYLNIPELDRKIFWAEIDECQRGFVSLEEFRTKIQIASPSQAQDDRTVGPMSPMSHWSSASSFDDWHRTRMASVTSSDGGLHLPTLSDRTNRKLSDHRAAQCHTPPPLEGLPRRYNRPNTEEPYGLDDTGLHELLAEVLRRLDGKGNCPNGGIAAGIEANGSEHLPPPVPAVGGNASCS